MSNQHLVSCLNYTVQTKFGLKLKSVPLAYCSNSIFSGTFEPELNEKNEKVDNLLGSCPYMYAASNTRCLLRY